VEVPPEAPPTPSPTAVPEAWQIPDERPRVRPGDSPGTGDRIFLGLSIGSGTLVLVIMGLVGAFLGYRAFEALSDAGFDFLTVQAWEPSTHHFGIAAVLFGTVLIGLTAVIVAVPLAIGTALYISEYAPRRLQRTFVSLVDLMAAVPSVVYGLWGAFFLQGHVIDISRFVSKYFGWFPPFSVNDTDGRVDPDNPLSSPTVYTSSTFIAGLVVGMMITPIVSSIMREAFMQAPPGEREGAYALGATRWGMIRAVVLPYGRGGMIGGTMLGLGRALGETIAVYMIISPVFTIQWHVLQNGAISVSSLIALRYGESQGLALSALFAAGFALFLMTLVVNFVASTIVARSRSGAGSEA